MELAHGISGTWDQEYDEGQIAAWAAQLRRKLQAPQVTLGLLFITPDYLSRAESLLELLRLHARIPLLVGCTSQGIIQGDKEIEETSGFVLGLYYLPGARLQGFHFTQADVEQAQTSAYWTERTGISAEASHGWLVFLDPFHLDSESWLEKWNQAYGPKPVVGGLAVGLPRVPETAVFLDGEVYPEGLVAVSFGGEVRLHAVVSQGCIPIGETWTITRADQNLIRMIGNRQAYQVLKDTFNHLTPEDQKKTKGNLLVGLVINEYLEDYQRGDFLIRNLLGTDPATGSLAVGAWPRTGQTVQFQRRDAAAATEDLSLMLQKAQEQLADKTIYGGCLCVCSGRGWRMFGESSHDARLVQHHLGPVTLTGFFCNGEIGPVGDRSFIHGFTSSLALFVKT
ncbi:MAG TPA: FIST N-terminal domain-containing protein [Candidatus Paceibacterota bacterium]|nr:FIST N-terminal domain-containing protein [Verrucomicrobiota bacterium]HRY46581.1 FIST N-terminal domain-containing protein [Candidatus Paceibacterota bacterium]